MSRTPHISVERGILFAEATLQDLRYGLRALRRSPGLTATALLTLALTTGAASTVLTLANTRLLRPMAANRPEELVVVVARRGLQWDRVSYADYADIRNRSRTIRDLVAHGSGGFLWVGVGGTTKRVSGAIVSAGFFSLLGVEPALGRFFSVDEDRVPNRDHVAVLSHHLWQEQWGAAPAVLGSAVKVNGVPFTVIGVAPEGFHGVDPQPSEIYVPTMTLGALRGCDLLANRDCGRDLQMIGRLRDGHTLDAVKAEVATLTPRHWNASATTKEAAKELSAFRPRGAYGTYAELRFADWPEGPILFSVAGACLLAGCANLAGLLAARGNSRARELAIRASLGVTPLRLLRQLMTESLLLAVSGGALGFILSIGLTRIVHSIFYAHDEMGRLFHFELRPDAPVVFGVTAVSLSAGFLFGLLPAMKSIRLGAALSLTRPGSAASARPFTRWLVGAQIALALALCTAAVLLWSSAQRFVTDGHFQPSQVALLRVQPEFLKYPPDKAQELHRAAVQRLEHLPGVLAVSLWDGGNVLSGSGATVSAAEDAASALPGKRAGWKAIGPRYFTVVGTPLLRGRDFDARDSPQSPRVAIVNESLARLLWPDEDPIGSTLVVNNGAPSEVVGIVADVYAPTRASSRVPHEVYVPFWQTRRGASASYCVRVLGGPAAALPMLVRAVNAVDPDVPVTETMPMMSQLSERDLKPVRMATAIAGYAATLAVLLSAIGVYGTLALSVARRTKEIGIRIAVGAAPHDVVGLIIKEEMTVVLTSVAAGIALAWGVSRLVRHLLYGAASGDGVLYAAAALVVSAVGFLACWIPARRAAQLDPMPALKEA